VGTLLEVQTWPHNALRPAATNAVANLPARIPNPSLPLPRAVEKVRVVIADPQTLFVQALESLLRTEPGIQVVGVATSFERLEPLIRHHRPHVVLMSMVLPDKGGMEVVRSLVEGNEDLRILLMGTQSFESHVPEAMEAGASGFVLKETDREELCRAIQDVHSGKPYINEQTSRKLVLDYLIGDRTSSRRKGPLTSREKELIDLVGAGYTNRQIASLLFISPKTVEAHKCNVMVKLWLNGSSELTRYAVLQGALDGCV